MLLQLSEWQQTTTALSITARRKRSKSAKKQPAGHASDVLPIAVSLVPPARRPRPSKRRKSDANGESDDVVPMLSVTAAHGVSVLGKSQPHLHSDALRESTRMQYSSRPGKQSSFLPEDADTNTSVPRLPAMVKSDRVYALQNGNKAIVSWSTAAEGPDDATTAGVARLTLPEPAVSMSIVGKSKTLLYGALRDGRCYIGFWASDSLKSHVFKSPQATKDGHHVSTTMVQTSAQGKSGGKRKQTEQGDENFVLTQVFANGNGFLVVKCQLSVVKGSVKISDGETTLSRMEVTPKDLADVCIDPTYVLHARSSESIAVLYEEVRKKDIINGKKTKRETRVHKISLLSLTDGLVKGDAFEVPESTRHFGFVTDNVLALATIDTILFYEVDRGILIRSINVSDVVSDTKDWSLITDNKKGNVFVLSAQPTQVHVAVANVSGKVTEANKQDFSLADGLRASMISNSHLVVTTEMLPTTDLLAQSPEGTAELQKSAVSDALASITACLDKVLDPKDSTNKENGLLDTYESALATILPIPLSPKKSNGQKQSKPKGKNGAHAKSPKRNSENDTLADRAETSPKTPQDFIDGATTLMIAALQLPNTESKAVDAKIERARLDARLILCRLISSGKVSARRHFQVFSDDDTDKDLLFAILRAMESTSKRERHSVSPVDLIHEMLSSCSDLTERQLVTMIHFTVCRALPDDLAENITESKRFDADHPSTMLAKEFLKLKSAEKKQKLTPKLLKASLTLLVERIVTYSKPNESLLRTALAQGLSSRLEAPTLARVLLEILGQADGVVRRQSYAATTKWIFILCEACRETLSAEASEGKSHLSDILGRLQQNIDHSNRIMSLESALHSAKGVSRNNDAEDADPVEAPKEPKMVHLQKETTAKKFSGYSIEQLIF